MPITSRIVCPNFLPDKNSSTAILPLEESLPKEEIPSNGRVFDKPSSLASEESLSEPETDQLDHIDVAVISKGDALVWIKRKHDIHA